MYQMGFGATRVDSALQRCNGDVPEATELLLGDDPNALEADDADDAASSRCDQTMCIVCFERPKTHLAVPCGHQSACAECAGKMTARAVEKCPYCGVNMSMWVEVRIV